MSKVHLRIFSIKSRRRPFNVDAKAIANKNVILVFNRIIFISFRRAYFRSLRCR